MPYRNVTLFSAFWEWHQTLERTTLLGQISFLVDGPLSEKGHKMLIGLLARRWCKSPNTCVYRQVCRKTEKAMATHSSTLAWKIPWTEEPGRLQSMGSLRLGLDWTTSLSLFTFMHWRRKWLPTPVFLPGESQGWGSLVGCRLWGRTESDTTEAT